jgi:hypothetical protein
MILQAAVNLQISILWRCCAYQTLIPKNNFGKLRLLNSATIAIFAITGSSCVSFRIQTASSRPDIDCIEGSSSNRASLTRLNLRDFKVFLQQQLRRHISKVAILKDGYKGISNQLATEGVPQKQREREQRHQNRGAKS